MNPRADVCRHRHAIVLSRKFPHCASSTGFSYLVLTFHISIEASAFHLCFFKDGVEMCCAELQQWLHILQGQRYTIKVLSGLVWLEVRAGAIPRKDRQLMSRNYFCKKHITDSDIERQRYYGELGG